MAEVLSYQCRLAGRRDLTLWTMAIATEILCHGATFLATRIGSVEKAERDELRQKQKEARRKKDPSMFVEASKLSRQIIALEKSADARRAVREERARKCGTAAQLIRRAVWALLLAALCGGFFSFIFGGGEGGGSCSGKGLEVLQLSSINTVGLGWLLRLGTSGLIAGSIGVPVGVFLLQRGADVCFARAGRSPAQECSRRGVSEVFSAMGL